MKLIRINKAEFDKFRELQIKKRTDCHAAFSSNLSENPWPFVTLGLTPEQLREMVRNLSPRLDQIVGIFVELRQSTSGGRFFIDYEGAYWKDKDKKEHRFIQWIPEGPLKSELPLISYDELLATTSRRRTRRI